MNAATRRGHPVVFGAIVLLSIIEMSIAAWITAQYNAHHNFPNASFQALVRYILFASLWTILLSSVYLALFFFMAGHMFSSIASHFVFLSLTWIFWLAAAAALTQAIGGTLDCHITGFAYCGQLNALEGFAWIVLVLLTFTLVFVLVRGIMGARRGEPVTAPMVEV